MTTLREILDETMTFVAAKHAGAEPVPLSGEFECPKAKPVVGATGMDIHEDTVRNNAIWEFEYDTAKPGRFRNVTIRSRGMGMNYAMPVPVYQRVEFSDAEVVRDGVKVSLPIDEAYVVGAWWLRAGRIPRNSWTLWHLEARVDPSVVVALAYQIDCGEVRPLTLEEIDALGDNFMPPKSLRPRILELIAGEDPPHWVCVGPSRYLLVLELCPHKEHDDFVPGGMMGFARLHPHAFLVGNDDFIDSFEITITMRRPAKAMTHGDPEMQEEIGTLLVTDANDVHALIDTAAPVLRDLRAFPYTDVLYDYYETEYATELAKRDPGSHDHLAQRTGEVTLADARWQGPRTIRNVITRNTPLVWGGVDVRKVPRQGHFDNVHLAPRMRIAFDDVGGNRVELNDVVMMNQCLHDCTHMHVRWSEFLDDADAHLMTWGWKNGEPFAAPGAPAVPENQTVFASFPDKHTLRYRALAEHPKPGEIQVICHHGLAYAVGEWPSVPSGIKREALLGLIRMKAQVAFEPWWREMVDGLTMTWAMFYWRVRFTRTSPKHGNEYILRSVFDINDCLREPHAP